MTGLNDNIIRLAFFRIGDRKSTEAIAEDGLRRFALFDRDSREFDRAITDPACQVEGPQRELWAGRVKGWVSPSDLERINALMTELTQLFFLAPNTTRNRLFSLQFLLAPATPEEYIYNAESNQSLP